jgi:ATP-binding cassette subfamily F protein uup
MIPLVSLSEIEKSFGTRNLFSDLSLVVAEGERTVLIGPNGAGKSTLFKIIAGEVLPDGGDISRRKGIKVGLVQQSDTHISAGTASEQLYSAIEDDSDAPRRVSRCLATLGFTDPSVSVESLSGGWRKRLALGRVLLQEPDLLLLDEPTNHLDIESILWLEGVIESFRGAVVSISHDRYFIERTAKRVIELNPFYPKGYFSSNGGYSDFLEAREEYLAQRENQRNSLANKVRREVEWLRQGVKARGTKSQARIKAAHSLQEELSDMRRGGDNAKMEIVGGDRKSKEYVVLKEISFGFESKNIVNSLTITIGPGVRLGITGPNGTGKTTLVKLLVGDLAPSTGTVKKAKNIQIVYLDQARSRMRDDATVREVLCPEGDSVVVQGKEHHIIPWAKRFLFSPEHLDKPLSKLSGGEKARALLAAIMTQHVDVLVLDEPTNDLDIPTREILESALVEFSGAVILVSHDRYMLDTVCTSLIGLNGRGDIFLCSDYAQWEATRAAQQAESKSAKPGQGAGKLKNPSEKNASGNKITYAEKIELSKIEGAILKAEELVKKLQLELSSNAGEQDRLWFEAHCKKLSEAESEVARLYDRWEYLSERGM